MGWFSATYDSLRVSTPIDSSKCRRSLCEHSKSAMSLTWALSLLGIKQAVNMITPGDSGQSQKQVLDPITGTTVRQLDELMKRIYRSDDNCSARRWIWFWQI